MLHRRVEEKVANLEIFAQVKDSQETHCELAKLRWP